jgi:hypothetical protein
MTILKYYQRTISIRPNLKVNVTSVIDNENKERFVSEFSVAMG